MQKLSVSPAPEEVVVNEPDLPAPCQAGELRAGEPCPVCRAARLDYNGLLNLACPNCGYSLGGGFT